MNTNSNLKIYFPPKYNSKSFKNKLASYRKVVLVYEPFTFGAAVAALAEGAISYLGGKAMATIMGDPSISDLSNIIKDAVKEIEAFIPIALQKAFEDHDLLTLTVTANAIQKSLDDYAGFEADGKIEMERNIGLLKSAEHDTLYSMGLAETYGLNGMIVYVNLASLRLLALAADHKLHPASGTRKSAWKTMLEGQGVSGTLAEQFGNAWDPANRISGIVYKVDGGDLGQKLHYVYWCIKDAGQKSQQQLFLWEEYRWSDEGPPNLDIVFKAYKAVIDHAQEEAVVAFRAVAEPVLYAHQSWFKAVRKMYKDQGDTMPKNPNDPSRKAVYSLKAAELKWSKSVKKAKTPRLTRVK